jgi:uncharacterized membrane protein (TIGR02234 family)
VIRLAQLLLLLSAGALWGASRMVWVEVASFDGLGQPKTTALNGTSWSTALVPLAVLLLAAAVAALAVRGWPLRLLAVLVAATSAGMAYLAISLWVIRDVAVRAAHLADVPVANWSTRSAHYGGAIIVGGAVGTLVGAVPSCARRKSQAGRPRAPQLGSRRRRPQRRLSGRSGTLDEGRDPTDPDNKGR